MSKTLLIYSPLSVMDMALKVEGHQEEFDILLGDSFSDEELELHESTLESIASIDVQPVIEELTFEDLIPRPEEEDRQRAFFATCRSCICLENVPYLESNPFQVTYLIDLLWTLDEVLIDRGGMEELVFKKSYLAELKRFKSMEVLLPQAKPVLPQSLGPVDQLFMDVHRELERLQLAGIELTERPEKLNELYNLVSQGKTDATTLLRQSGLNPKDFGDRLESLKFFLKKH